jgi:hypothetical protein
MWGEVNGRHSISLLNGPEDFLCVVEEDIERLRK